MLEAERVASGELEPALTLFLAGAECPFTCVFCDLWRHTSEAPTPAGSLPMQIERGLAEALGGAGSPKPAATRLKLYNASNFFERRAVPPADEPAILALTRPFRRVVVECHPTLVGEHCLRFAEVLGGRLEVAMGLETVHPEALPRLNKQMTLAQFDAASERLRTAGIALRAFVLVGAPFVPPEESVDWAVRSAEHAFARGAERVVLIPVRGGNGEMERLRATGHFTPPTLAQVEEALDRALPLAAEAGGVVEVDTWDLERFAACPACFPGRRARLERILRTGAAEPRVACAECSEQLGGLR